MEALKKIAFCAGISIAVCGFGVILYANLPSIIQNSDWDKLDGFVPNEEAILKKFKHILHM